MAALALAAGLVPVSSPAAPPSTGERPKTEAADASTGRTVRLELVIAGLGAKGCDVVVKPASPACAFRSETPLPTHVSSRGYASVVLRDVSTQSADRDCTFAITIREPGQGERTVRRGLRLASKPGSSGQVFTCYLSSPSKLARAEESGTTKR
jgi:hypothetical protein